MITGFIVAMLVIFFDSDPSIQILFAAFPYHVDHSLWFDNNLAELIMGLEVNL